MFEYEIIRSAKRRTLSIEVHKDARVVVRAPLKCAETWITENIHERTDWIQKQLLRCQQNPPPPPLQYQEGEPHLFLGERFPLVFCHGRKIGVTLHDDTLQISAPFPLDSKNVHAVLERWYKVQAHKVFHRIFENYFVLFAARGHARPELSIRKMKSRWGSMIGNRRMTLNRELIRTQERCIEYVIMHEFCHLEHKNHGKGFYRLLSKMMPDWKERKTDLNSALVL